jgi:penicillin amidase
MRSKWQRRLGILGAVLVACMLLGAATLSWSSTRPFPDVSGEIGLPGLDGPVDVYRDSMGIPHIYATTAHDLFMAQGYVHAQDRFWQMDVWRHIGAGRLAEMFGSDQVETDEFLRTLGWEQLARVEWEQATPEMQEILSAYAAGVNAYLAQRSPAELSFEYSILELVNRSYTPAPWEPINTLTWAKALAWELRGNMDSEIVRSLLAADLTPDQLADLYPSYPADHPVITGGEYGIAHTVPAAPPVTTELVAEAAARFEDLDRWLPGGDAGIGSNSWAIAGSRTASGAPILANDPHLASQIPSIWYQIGLHCTATGPDCPYRVAGFSFAGAPGVVIGHNERIAWGFTNLGPDVMDLYIERVNPDNPDQYEVNGEWREMEITTETISVGGGDSVELTIRSTRNGPIITDVYGPLEDFTAEAGIDLPGHYAIALQWTALEPGRTFEAILGFNRAAGWDDFRAATRLFEVPAQNLLYADVDGNIGYQAPGRIPIRASGDGRFPVPGWTDDFGWAGYIPFEELPSVYNPASGYIVTANNAVVGPDYPYLLTADWNFGHRAQRIVDMVESAAGVTLDDVAAMQNDTYDLNAERVVPYFLDLSPGDEDERAALDVLRNWDFHTGIDSAGAALFGALWRELLIAGFNDELPEDLEARGGSRWFVVVADLLDEPTSAWWDDMSTPEREDRDIILGTVLASAVDEVHDRFGDDPEDWRWGAMHTLTFENQTLGDAGIGFIESRFNRGPYETPGGKDIVNAIGWDVPDGFEVNWLPSMRMIIDLGDLGNSRTVHTTGQSGHAFHDHYTDMVEMWIAGEYYPMYWERTAVEAASNDRLVLAP